MLRELLRDTRVCSNCGYRFDRVAPPQPGRCASNGSSSATDASVAPHMMKPGAPSAASALHGYLIENHLRDGVLVGPDSGVRINLRVGRFLKSYTRRLPWRDDLCYMQTQGYWCLANWQLADAEHAVACAGGIIARQRPDGAWQYPNPEWRGRVATLEGAWAALGLIETYRQTNDSTYLDAALRWHRFLEEEIGWREAPGGEAVEYFAGESKRPVPNNSTFVARLLAEFAEVTGDKRFLARCEPMLAFIATVQRPSGELPYQVNPDGTSGPLEHYQCSQYNAFQLLDLARYEALTHDILAARVVVRLAEFLRGLVAPDGTIPYACDRLHPHVTYHLAAVAAALDEAAQRGVAASESASAAVLARLLERQRSDGGFPHSCRDYGFIADRRSYPRNLAMILLHLLAGERSTPRRP